ncbi:hypothetical protein Emag_003442 [Eimeria magna]
MPVAGSLSLEGLQLLSLSVGALTACTESPKNACGFEWVQGSQVLQVDCDEQRQLVKSETDQWTITTHVEKRDTKSSTFRVYAHLNPQAEVQLPSVAAAELSLRVSGSLGNKPFTATPKVSFHSLWPSRGLKAWAQLRLLDTPTTNSDLASEASTDDAGSQDADLANAATSPVYIQVLTSQWSLTPIEDTAAAAAATDTPAAATAAAATAAAATAAAATTAAATAAADTLKGFTLELGLDVPEGQQQLRPPTFFEVLMEALRRLFIPVLFFIAAAAAAAAQGVEPLPEIVFASPRHRLLLEEPPCPRSHTGSPLPRMQPTCNSSSSSSSNSKVFAAAAAAAKSRCTSSSSSSSGRPTSGSGSRSRALARNKH